MKLQAYQINGQTCGLDIFTWNSDQLNGNKPFIVNSTIQSGYTDITSMENYHKFGEQVVYDWQDLQRAIKLEYFSKGGWTACTNDEKMLVIQYYLDPDKGQGVESTQQVMFLMSQGYSLEEAQMYMLDCWSDYFSKFTENTKNRLLRAIKYLVANMSLTEAANLDTKVTDLKSLFIFSANLGIGYGDSVPGIMNFMLSNHGYETNGFASQNYTINMSVEDFVLGFEYTLIDNVFWPELKQYY